MCSSAVAQVFKQQPSKLYTIDHILTLNDDLEVFESIVIYKPLRHLLLYTCCHKSSLFEKLSVMTRDRAP